MYMFTLHTTEVNANIEDSKGCWNLLLYAVIEDI